VTSDSIYALWKTQNLQAETQSTALHIFWNWGPTKK